MALVLLLSGVGVLADARQQPSPGRVQANQLHLTWPRDPRWTIGIQWQTQTSTRNVVLVAGPDRDWRRKHGRPPPERAVTGGRLHQVEVTGLRPDTEYRYSVSTDTGMSRPYSFRTAPSRPASRSPPSPTRATAGPTARRAR